MIYSNSFVLINNKMKKIIFSFVSAVSLVFVAESVTYMRVNTTDGKTVLYEVNNVETVDFFEAPNDTILDVLSVSGSTDGYNYVDLGLSSGIKWATYNVGATQPTEIGDYFAWGEISVKEYYGWNTYKWCDGTSNSLTKYCSSESYGIVDNKKELDSADDAVTSRWGENWRMPTTTEQKELFEGCDWTWTTDFKESGVAGYLGVSKKNGNTIFLPAAGYKYDSSVNAEHGIYWSSTRDDSFMESACAVDFYENEIQWNIYSRYYGHCVRAVVIDD